MSKHTIGIIISIIAVVGIIMVAYMLYTTTGGNDETYALIHSHWTGSGKFVDWTGDTGVKDETDIRFYVNLPKSRVEISYGNLILIYSINDLKEKETETKLNYIGLTYIYNDDATEFRFKWQDVEIEQWAKSVVIGQ